MTMYPRVLVGLTILFVVSFLASAAVHWLIVCRDLYRQGEKIPTGLLPWRIFGEMARYKDLCREHSDSLSRYYIILLCLWFNVILGVSLALWWLWECTHQTP